MAHNKQTYTVNTKQGFALLMTLVVVSVIISIGLTVLDLSIKQVRLSTNVKESESAFHAANAGFECARYWRREASTTMESGGDLSTPPLTKNFRCFSQSPVTNTKTVVSSTADGNITVYDFRFTWSSNQRCSMMSTLVMKATPQGAGLSVNPKTYIPEYPTSSLICAAGQSCTVISAHGFNRSCATKDGYGSVEREVLLQF